MAKASAKKSNSKILYVGYSVANIKGKKSIHLHVSGQKSKYAVFVELPEGSAQPNSQAFFWYSLDPHIKTKSEAAKWLAAKQLPSDVKKYLNERAEAFAD